MTLDAHRAFLSMIFLATAAPVFGQVPCEFEWPGPAVSATLDGPISDMVEYDEDGLGGNSPYLVAIGFFGTTVNGDPGAPELNGVAKWDGVKWSPMGSGLVFENIGFHRRFLVVWDRDGDGPELPGLYAYAITPSANSAGLSLWNGANWNRAARGLNGDVNALCVFDEDGAGPNPPILFAAGTLSIFSYYNEFWGGLARLKGDQWQGVGISYAGEYGEAMTVFDEDGAGPMPPNLYVSGWFSDAQGAVRRGFSRSNGTSLSPVIPYELLNGHPIFVNSILAFDEDGAGAAPPQLFGGGSFFFDLHQSTGVARWNGTQWTPVVSNDPGSPTANINCDKLYLAESMGVDHDQTWMIAAGSGVIIRWDGKNWRIIGSGIGNVFFDQSPSIAMFDDDGEGLHTKKMFVGGAISMPSMGGMFMGSMVRFDDPEWRPILGDGLSSGSFFPQPTTINEIATAPMGTDTDIALYVTGSFLAAGSAPCAGVAKYQGGSWSSISNDFSVWPEAVMTVKSNSVSGHDLILGGGFKEISGTKAENIAAWDGISWRPLGGGLGGDQFSSVRSLASYDPDGPGAMPRCIVAAGSFNRSGDTVLNNIAIWDGERWLPLGAGSESAPYGLAVFDDDGDGPDSETLFAAGSFSVEGDPEPAYLAQWNGVYWKRWGEVDCRWFLASTSGQVGFPQVDPPGVYVSGYFVLSGNNATFEVAKWDGGHWVFLPTNAVGYPFVYGMAIMDADGDGSEPPMLIIGGSFDSIGGVATEGLARWDGRQWHAIKVRHEPFYSGPLSLCPFDDDGPGPHLPRLMIGGYSGLTQWGQPLPYFRWQPEHMTAALGGTAMFQVRMGGAEPMTYQWRKDGVPLSETRRVSGVKRPLLKIERAMTTDVGQYDVIVTNHCGSQVSRAAALKIDEKQSAVHE